MPKPQKHGNKWRIRPVNEFGKRSVLSFDSYEEADLALKTEVSRVAQVKAGQGSPLVRGKPFSDLSDYWLRNVSIHKRSNKDDISIINKHLKPYFGKLRVSEINTQHTDGFRRQKSKKLTDKTVHNILTLLKSMLNRAHRRNWISSVPYLEKPKIQYLDENFRYLRNDEDIDDLAPNN